MQNINVDINENEVGKFYEVYQQGFEPHKWILKVNNWKNYLQYTTVYYNSSDNKSTTLQNVIELTKRREPVNISMDRYYDEENLKSLWNYSQGIYGSFHHSINI